VGLAWRRAKVGVRVRVRVRARVRVSVGPHLVAERTEEAFQRPLGLAWLGLRS
jgi:hypothetical protein